MEREAIFDIMKGIGILAVIAGHSAGQLTFVDAVSWKLIYSFHMPMFFIIAGYFYKEKHELLQKTKRDFKRLILPYIATSICFFFYQMLTDETFCTTYKYTLIAFLWGTGESHTSAIWPNMPHIGAIWFLLALFWCRTFFNIIFIKTKHPYIIVIITAVIATIIDRYVINLPLGILPGLSALSFYLLGYYFRHFKINQYEILLCAVCWIIHIFYSRIDMCNCFYKYYPIDILGTTFGTMLAYIISKKISFFSYSKYITKLGQTSLIILCFHTLENNIIDYDKIPITQNHWFILFTFRSVLCVSLTYIWYILVNYTSFFKSKVLNL